MSRRWALYLRLPAFARTAGANAPAGDVDDEEHDENEDVEEGEEKIEDEKSWSLWSTRQQAQAQASTVWIDKVAAHFD